MPAPEIRVARDFGSAVREAAEFILSLPDRPDNPPQRPSAPTIVLAGGDTPLDLYRHLGNNRPELREARQRETGEAPAFGPSFINSHVFWGDERAVAIDSPRSNYAAAYRALLEPLAFPAGRIHRIRTEAADLEAVASGYEAEIRRVFAEIGEDRARFSDSPDDGRFDLVLLGLGGDGHIASLFPRSPELDEENRWVVPSVQPETGERRVTMTLPLLNRARNVLFLVAGEGKAGMVNKVFAARGPDKSLPATLVRPDRGRVVWILDAAAAGRRPTSAGA